MLLFARLLWLPAAAFALGACSSIDYESFRAPDLSVIAPKTMATLRETALKPVTNEDLVDTEGRCPGVPFGPDPNLPGDAQQNSNPALPGAIGLDMTECEVVKRAGHPTRVEFGTNEHGERTVVLTYMSGQRPGIYSFASGRLKSVERVAEPAPPPKPQKQQKRPPPKQKAAT